MELMVLLTIVFIIFIIIKIIKFIFIWIKIFFISWGMGAKGSSFGYTVAYMLSKGEIRDILSKDMV